MNKVNGWLAVVLGLFLWPAVITSSEWIHCRRSGQRDCTDQIEAAITAPFTAAGFILGRVIARKEEDDSRVSEHQELMRIVHNGKPGEKPGGKPGGKPSGKPGGERKPKEKPPADLGRKVTPIPPPQFNPEQ